MSEDINNSSLSVDNIANDLTGTQVECANGDDVTIGSYNICITGSHVYHCNLATMCICS